MTLEDGLHPFAPETFQPRLLYSVDGEINSTKLEQALTLGVDFTVNYTWSTDGRSVYTFNVSDTLRRAVRFLLRSDLFHTRRHFEEKEGGT